MVRNQGTSPEEVAPVKSTDAETAVPHAWRDTLRDIVRSLMRKDPQIGQGLDAVEPLSEELSSQCLQAVADYGSVELVELPEEAWSTAVAMWQGSSWQCIVDLWTAEEGRSDLVLEVEVFEDRGTEFRYRIHLVYVP